ncbi:N-6 DNA methylase [Streptomyces rubiginosohelvolus]|uniref:class I SAM-dependent DNA methyltransferase n=1 Tax=Streptomyces rubiginosohelvolus TaxID=67362 RepID=UPI0036A27DEE
MDGKQALTASIRAVADLLRGDFRRSDYGVVILPFTLLRRADCIQEPTPSADSEQPLGGLQATGGRGWLGTLLKDTADESALAEGLNQFVHHLPADVVEVLNGFSFQYSVERLAQAGLLRHVAARFAALDLRTAAVPNRQMGLVYEELARGFFDEDPQVSGEFTTPPDVSELIVRLLTDPYTPAAEPSAEPVRVYDPCCGSGGLLISIETYLRKAGKASQVSVHGQDINTTSYAMARSMRMMYGAEPGGIHCGDVLANDLYQGETFAYLTAHPPIGLHWRAQRTQVLSETGDPSGPGRFGAGVPKESDASLLFVQHVVAHMRPASDGGARAALLLGPAPLSGGGYRSGESSIRQWLLDKDLLEGVVALPNGLWPNHSRQMYLWLLSNRKPPHLRGKLVALDARDEFEAEGRQVVRRGSLTSTHIARIVARYAGCGTATPQGGVRLLDTDQLVYRDVVINRPLRQRFEISDAALAVITKSKALNTDPEPETLTEALRALNGKSWTTWRSFTTELKTSGRTAELSRSLATVVRRAIAVSDPTSEIQKDERGQPLPDADLQHVVRVQRDLDVRKFMRDEIAPYFPDAWTDRDDVRTTCELPLAPFLTSTPGSGFGPLSSVAWQIPARPGRRPEEGLPILRSAELRTAIAASTLREDDWPSLPLALCTGGDVVGRGSDWRVLPTDFGEALTPLTVLRPIGGTGPALCEWLRTGTSATGEYHAPRLAPHAPVPVALITDSAFQKLLEDLQAGRDALAENAARILPNVFHDPTAPLDEMRRDARTAASESRTVEELARPMGDPVWRAEMTYPYPVAVLCRQYRVATTFAQRKEALLKLGEALTRCIGVLALRIRIDRQGHFTRKMRDTFTRGAGATFGTWEEQIKALAAEGGITELPELEVRDLVGEGRPLSELRNLRNRSGHAKRVQPEHELEREVEVLKELIVTALEAAGWLSGVHWDVVDLCAYSGDGGFMLSGRRLRGSHPDWEPFDRPHPGTAEPHRLYVRSSTSPKALDLWQVARVEVCLGCDARELFLLHRIDERNKQMLLSCGRDHEIAHLLV